MAKSILNKYNDDFLCNLQSSLNLKVNNIPKKYVPEEILQTRNNKSRLYEKHGIDKNKKPAIALENDFSPINFNLMKSHLESKFNSQKPAKKISVLDQLNKMSSQIQTISKQLETLKKEYSHDNSPHIDWYHHYYQNDNWFYFYSKLVDFIKTNKRYPTHFGNRTEQFLHKWYTLQKLKQETLTSQKINLLERIKNCIKINL